MTADESKTNYESKLRLWYLARLRKSYLGFELANQSTPNTLVGADNFAIRQKLLEESVEAGSEKRSLDSGTPRFAVLIGSFVLASLVTLLVFFFS